MPSSPDTPAAIVRRKARCFRRDRRGSAAVEFALVAPVFFGLLFAIIEAALVFFASQTLETATQDVARLVMTGQAQGIGYSQSQFKDQVCSRISALFDCQNGIYVDVESFPSFDKAIPPDAIDPNKQFVTTMQYKPGQACDVVLVRLFYQWPVFITRLGYDYDMSNLGNGKRLLTATAAFRNEPFGSGACP
jgi:Flp pilus assembly protein TadG